MNNIMGSVKGTMGDVKGQKMGNVKGATDDLNMGCQVPIQRTTLQQPCCTACSKCCMHEVHSHELVTAICLAKQAQHCKHAMQTSQSCTPE